ncbi:hypothetical protein vseg_010379 [Gypsophila vaccaria]
MSEEQAPYRTAVDEHYLDLTLTLGPLNYENNSSSGGGAGGVGMMMGKREQQSMRRRDAKAKRAFKRTRTGHRPPAAAALSKEGHYGLFSSSSVSTAASSSLSGGNSSDTSSHSSHQHAHSPAMNLPTQSSIPTQPTSPPREHTPSNSCNQNHPQSQLHSSSSNQTHVVDNTNQPSVPLTSNEAKVVIGKPPKPNGQTTSKESGLAPQMPCVTATGNGPKGKTITGFLYKYTKTEVSIVCVCHGASFSPAGFVEHAGGVDVEHPLKHIRVAPFPLS